MKSQTTVEYEVQLLAPIEIWEVLLDHSTIKFHEPLVLMPELLPPEEPGDKSYLKIVSPKLGVDVFAADRDELLEFVLADIRFAWENFVQIDNDQLSNNGKRIKKYYLDIAEEIDA